MKEGTGMKWIAIESVKLWKSNPRETEQAAKDIAELIKVHGVNSPIVVWDKNNTVYKGNATLKACLLLKMKKVPAIFVSFKDESSAIAYGISDNKASEYAEWNKADLVKLLSNKEVLSHSTGFDKKEITILADKLQKQREKQDTKTDGNSPAAKEKKTGKAAAPAKEKEAPAFSSDSIVSKVIISCQPKDGKEIYSFIKEWANGCGYDNVSVSCD